MTAADAGAPRLGGAAAIRRAADVLAPLEPGARVALVATSGPVDPARLDRSMALLRSWGLQPVAYPSASARHPRADYLAGDDAVRAGDLSTAWCDPSIAAVFCLRGGYGSIRLLDRLDVDRLRSAPPKALFGSSDVTAVHELWNGRLATPTWFGPMLGTDALLEDAVATEGLRRAVFEPLPGREYSSPGTETLVAGTATGRVVGGTLSLLRMTLGSAESDGLDRSGAIVLLEDVTEEPYRLDALLSSLLRAGWFEGVAGIALGSWESCGDPSEVRALMLELLGPLGVPLVWDLGFGHCANAHTLPLGIEATLHADGRPRLVVHG
ncbi:MULTISPECIES: S66 peptidase family protein [unclassified Agromyces]|uniref:S66 peptidase family protein n=1 Tax=unclassified Agromyces TaxID=2639701 RepID=UPI003014B109